MESGAGYGLNALGDGIKILGRHIDSVRDQTWSKRKCDTELQVFQLDLVNTHREDMRDQVRLVFSSLECLILVAALFLEHAFKTMCEGTFPDSEADGQHYTWLEDFGLRVWSVLGALTLTLPFLCLVMAMEIFSQAQRWSQASCSTLQGHMQAAARCETGPTQSQGQAQAARHIPEGRPFRRLGTRHMKRRFEERLTNTAGIVRPEPSWYNRYAQAQLLLLFGMLCGALLTGVEYGIILAIHFPTMPELSCIYFGMVTAGAVVCLSFGLWTLLKINAPEVMRIRERNYLADLANFEEAQGASPASSRTERYVSTPRRVNQLVERTYSRIAGLLVWGPRTPPIPSLEPLLGRPLFLPPLPD